MRNNQKPFEFPTFCFWPGTVAELESGRRFKGISSFSQYRPGPFSFLKLRFYYIIFEIECYVNSSTNKTRFMSHNFDKLPDHAWRFLINIFITWSTLTEKYLKKIILQSDTFLKIGIKQVTSVFWTFKSPRHRSLKFQTNVICYCLVDEPTEKSGLTQP